MVSLTFPKRCAPLHRCDQTGPVRSPPVPPSEVSSKKSKASSAFGHRASLGDWTSRPENVERRRVGVGRWVRLIASRGTMRSVGGRRHGHWLSRRCVEAFEGGMCVFWFVATPKVGKEWKKNNKVWKDGRDDSKLGRGTHSCTFTLKSIGHD